MDGLIGCIGARVEDDLQRMAGVLSHRGQVRSDECIKTNQGAIARLSCWTGSSVGIPLPRRAISTEQHSAVLCGFLTRLTNRRFENQIDPLAGLLAEFQSTGELVLPEGSFLLAILEHGANRAHLFRDGAGTRTVYHAAVGQQWYFASEPKAIIHATGFVPRIRPAAIAQYLSFSFVPGAGTMLTGLQEVPCGHQVTLQCGHEPITTNRFPFEEFEPAETAKDFSTEDEQAWITRTRGAVEQAVAERLPQGEPVGVFLSGGLDSSIIAAEVARQHNHRVLTYSIHFGDQYKHELDFARAVATRIRSEHHEVLIQPRDFAPRLREMVWHLDDPIGDPITQPNFELARRVSQDTRWVFNGEGGDPVFGGPKNIPMMLQHWYGQPRDSNFRERAYLASYRRAYEECARLLHPEIRSSLDWSTDLEQILTPYFSATPLRSFLNKLMAINIRLKGAHLILPKVERMLNASRLTPLSPLFSEELIRLSFAMPPRMKLRYGVEKWVLKRAYENDLPREIIDRPKSGMRVPVHFWFRGDLHRLARQVLLKKPAKGTIPLFDQQRIKQLLRYDIEEGMGRYGMRLWMLTTLELWRQVVAKHAEIDFSPRHQTSLIDSHPADRSVTA